MALVANGVAKRLPNDGFSPKPILLKCLAEISGQQRLASTRSRTWVSNYDSR
jgi:hypothetical protein